VRHHLSTLGFFSTHPSNKKILPRKGKRREETDVTEDTKEKREEEKNKEEKTRTRRVKQQLILQKQLCPEKEKGEGRAERERERMSINR